MKPQAESQSRVSTLTSLWSWLLPTQKVTGVVELSTNTVRMFVSDGMRYCATAQYLMPTDTNMRTVFVDNSTTPVTFWVGSNHDHRLVKVETRD